ncbi:MAG: cobyrinate a,c-diamide synthase, partial [Thiolinea sp.]
APPASLSNGVAAAIQGLEYTANMAGLFISAAHKSSGKTTLSIGICAALHAQGVQVQPFKKGPDYIDPLWLGAASGRPCHNLDFNTMHTAEIRHTVAHYAAHADLRFVEANKGLFDGVAIDGSDSNAALAKLLELPVVLVIDTRGMTRGIAPLLLGYQQFDPEVHIAGVILNRTGGARHAAKLRTAVETYTDLPVLGAVRNDPALEIEERHLGLMPSNESQAAAQQIEQIRTQVAEQVDLGMLQQLAASAAPLPKITPLSAAADMTTPDVRIAICQDAAFGFYYPGDLEALQQAGAELVAVNTLQDAGLPEAIDGLFIGGGFPETQMQALAANHGLRQAIRGAIEDGLPTYAECGGLMYLSRSLRWNGEIVGMVGVIPGDVVMYERPQGRGYVQVQETAAMPWPGGVPEAVIRAHEFHYSALENLTERGQFAYRMLRGTGIDGQHDGWLYKNLLASYTHMRHTEQFPWAQRFVAFVRAKRQERNNRLWL